MPKPDERPEPADDAEARRRWTRKRHSRRGRDSSVAPYADRAADITHQPEPLTHGDEETKPG